MDSFEIQYGKALSSILRVGDLRPNRTGTSAYSLFDVAFEFDVSKHYPILTGKQIKVDIVNAEFEWLITGQTNTKLFKDRGIKIWDAWADDAGNLGPVYGHQLRNFNSQNVDQLAFVINTLQKDPYSRRLVMSLWNPVQLPEMRLPPCYLYFQFYADTINNRLNMFVVQRSGDMFAGVPYDVCLFTNLLNYVCLASYKFKPGIISHKIVDAHIYTNHLSGTTEYLNRPILSSPRYTTDLFGNAILQDYKHLPFIKIPIAV